MAGAISGKSGSVVLGTSNPPLSGGFDRWSATITVGHLELPFHWDDTKNGIVTLGLDYILNGTARAYFTGTSFVLTNIAALFKSPEAGFLLTADTGNKNFSFSGLITSIGHSVVRNEVQIMDVGFVSSGEITMDYSGA